MSAEAGLPVRVLVIEDEPDTALYVRHVLDRAGFAATVVGSIRDAMRAVDGAAVAGAAFDVALADVEIADGDGLDLAGVLAARGIPVAVTTAHASLDRAVVAIRRNVREFLPKPVASAQLVSVLGRLGRETQLARHTGRRRVVAIGAHPDDVEIGVGATLAAHAAAGDELLIVTLCRGGRGGPAASRLAEATAAAGLLGARLMTADLTDTAIPEGDPTVGVIENAVREFAPDLAYTHSLNDVHQDHRAVHRASMVALRRVGTVACFQSPSATIDFRPTAFVDVTGHLQTKLELIACYRSQATIRDYLDPDVLTSTARYWSRYAQHAEFAEPLEVIRERISHHPTSPATRGLPIELENHHVA